MKQKIAVAMVLVFSLFCFIGCTRNSDSSQIEALEREVSGLEQKLAEAEKESTASNEINVPTSSSKSTELTIFTNKFGTPTTECAHSGCKKYIASTGDTNCCVSHSQKCADCGKYIDEDAFMCMDCILK